MGTNGGLDKQAYVSENSVEGACGGSVIPVARIPATNAINWKGAARAAVVPIRQFCEVKKPNRENAASFFHIDDLEFVPLEEVGRNNATCHTASGVAAARSLPVVHARDVTPSQDLRDAVHAAYCQEALDDETSALLETAYNDDRPDGQGGGQKWDFWVNGQTGKDIIDDSSIDGGAGASLTCAGLFAARKKIEDADFGTEQLVCYTTENAIKNLGKDPDFTERRDFMPRVVAAGSVACVDGITLVAASRLPPTRGARGAGVRSVMFVPHVSFGLISDDTIKVSEEWSGDHGCCFKAHHVVGGAVINVKSTCRISHA